jgi:hypothetical protein
MRVLSATSKAVPLLLLTTIILNCIDCSLTLYWVYSHQAYELNPFLSRFIHNPLLFSVVKMGLVLSGSAILYKYRESILTQVSTIILTLIYVCIVGYHIGYIL